MSLQANQYSPPNFLELPSTWLAHLFQHVASGPRGLASAAALSQTCKPIYALSESSAVKYRDLHLDHPVNSFSHPFFRWISKRHSRVAGLTAELRLLRVGSPEPEAEQLQLMFSIPALHLTLFFVALISTPNDPFMTKVLRPHGHLIDRLEASVRTDTDSLTLQDFCEAAAACRSLNLTATQQSGEALNIGALKPVTGSLVRLKLGSGGCHWMPLDGFSSLCSFSKLRSLSLTTFGFAEQHPWLWMA